MNTIYLHGVKCWIVNLMPFSEKKRDSFKVLPFQKACIEHKIFGMGWGTDIITDIPDNAKLDDFSKKIYETKAKEKEEYRNEPYKSALNSYQEISDGDFVIMRLKNSHYYIGRIIGNAKYIQRLFVDGANRLSWGCNVDEWIELENEEKIPSEIVGRFSQKYHSTIQQVSNLRLKALIISLYEHKSNKCGFNIPKIFLNESNFVTTLNYMELEDLVSQFIYDKHRENGYVLLPSSCKVNKQNYEFSFVSKIGKPITCQVKNQESIDPKGYAKEDSYEKKYLFSGKWSQEEADRLKEEYKNTNIYIISKSELYKTLNENSYLKNKLAKFYNIDNNTVHSYEMIKNILEENPKTKECIVYKKCRFTKNKIYKFNDNRKIIYIGNYECFYSPEFNSIFINSSDKTYDDSIEKFKNTFDI
jgi:hypothetical protein